MTVEAGYYDGRHFLPLRKMAVKPNQKVIITVLDEFVEPRAQSEGESVDEINALIERTGMNAWGESPVALEGAREFTKNDVW